MTSSLRRARFATFGYFALNGFVLGIWLVHIPGIEHHVHISHALLGALLVLVGLGAFLGMQVVGPIANRHNPRVVLAVSGAVAAASLIGPGIAFNAPTLGVALFVLGFGNGCLDVSQNTHAVQVEVRYGRPIMSAFHAMWSIGGFAAALVGARTLSWGLTPKTTLVTVALLGVVVALVIAPLALPDAPAAAATAAERSDRPRSSWRHTPRHIWGLALLAFILFMSEGIANDWSALAARDGLGASAAMAALTYGAFAAAMTIGRFAADRIVARIGPSQLVRWGAGLAAVSVAIVALSPGIGLTIVAWALYGFGLSGTVPQLFSEAGRYNESMAGVNVSRVAGLGYVGGLAGPAIIGPLTHVVSITHTFFVPVALCAAAAVGARILPRRSLLQAPLTLAPHSEEPT